MGILDRAGLPREVYASLAAAAGNRPRVLAWALGAHGPVVGMPDRLAISGPDGWLFVPWHEIGAGAWNAENGQLRWTLVDGQSDAVQVDDAGSLPDVFRERVGASIVVQQRVELDRGRAAMIVARRRLDDRAAPLVWSVTRQGATWDEEQLARAEAELARVQAEYDIR